MPERARRGAREARTTRRRLVGTVKSVVLARGRARARGRAQVAVSCALRSALSPTRTHSDATGPQRLRYATPSVIATCDAHVSSGP